MYFAVGRFAKILCISWHFLSSKSFTIRNKVHQHVVETYSTSPLHVFAKNTDFVLAKTKESFKLSDLYLLETKLESDARNWTNPNLLAIDANTGSYLFQIDRKILGKNDSECFQPSCMDRYDWITKRIIATGSSGEDLVQNILQQCRIIPSHDLENFAIEYICMGVMMEKDYTSKNLICRVAQCIQAPAALSTKKSAIQLILIETPTQIYLAQKEHLNIKENRVAKRWSNRPYQYSSAINPTIALIVIDLLHDLIRRKARRDTDDVRMLDATCGSGTFLAFALDKGMNVTGNDIKDKCCEGSLRNLRYLFDDKNKIVEKRCDLIVSDFASSDKLSDVLGVFDCAVTNLPWGQNTEIKNKDDNLVRFQTSSCYVSDKYVP
jgi:tRNA G10  N-methylase Trm11